VEREKKPSKSSEAAASMNIVGKQGEEEPGYQCGALFFKRLNDLAARSEVAKFRLFFAASGGDWTRKKNSNQRFLQFMPDASAAR